MEPSICRSHQIASFFSSQTSPLPCSSTSEKPPPSARALGRAPTGPSPPAQGRAPAGPFLPALREPPPSPRKVELRPAPSRRRQAELRPTPSRLRCGSLRPRRARPSFDRPLPVGAAGATVLTSQGQALAGPCSSAPREPSPSPRRAELWPTHARRRGVSRRHRRIGLAGRYLRSQLQAARGGRKERQRRKETDK